MSSTERPDGESDSVDSSADSSANESANPGDASVQGPDAGPDAESKDESAAIEATPVLHTIGNALRSEEDASEEDVSESDPGSVSGNADSTDVAGDGSNDASTVVPIGTATSSDDELAEQERWRAIVLGEEFSDWPTDLYIPPEALEVFLEAFEGPLDLLLWLIRKQNLNILDIPVARITEQYMKYVEMMRSLRLDLAAEYLVMAATLAEIKSRMLLPKPEMEEGEDAMDPRAALVLQLQQYEVFRTAALEIEDKPRLERDIFVARGAFEDESYEAPDPDVSVGELVKAFQHVLEIAARNKHFTIGVEVLSLRERMVVILAQLQEQSPLRFVDLFEFTEGRLGLAVTFSAILELYKEQSLVIVQDDPYDQILVTTQGDAPAEPVIRTVETND